MVRFPKALLGLFVAVGFSIAGCNGSVPSDVAEPAPVEVEEPVVIEEDGPGVVADSAEVSTPSVAAQPNAGGDTGANTEMVAVSIYVMDDSCNNFQAESIEVSAEQPMTAAVGEVLERHDFEAFELSGYRVKVEDSKAIVDLRLAEDSERQFLSLSSCEQQGLFGGLEETLTQNQTWQVNQVEFTNRGEEIVL